MYVCMYVLCVDHTADNLEQFCYLETNKILNIIYFVSCKTAIFHYFQTKRNNYNLASMASFFFCDIMQQLF